MNRFKAILATSTLGLIFFSSCEKTETPPKQPVESFIELSEKAVTAGPEGGEFNIDITSSANWKIAGYCDWITFKNETGESGTPLSFTVAPNFSEKDKIVQFKIFSGNAVDTLSITSTPNIIFSFENKMIDGEEVTIDKTSIASTSTKFAVILMTNAEDVTVEYVGGAEKWLKNTTVTTELIGKRIYEFISKDSDVFKERVGSIRFNSVSANKSLEFSVIQKQHDTVFIKEGDKFIKDLSAIDETLTIQSNVPFAYRFPSWITEVEKVVGSQDENTGLTSTTIKIHADEAKGSRAVTVQFHDLNRPIIYGSVFIKQQNPNPKFVTITDRQLRKTLNDAEWILAEPGSDKCEVINNGMAETELEITNDVANFSELGQFSQLATLSLRNDYIDYVDLTAVQSIVEVKVSRTLCLSNVKLGNNVKKFVFDRPEEDYMTASSFALSGTNVEEVNVSSTSMMIGYGFDGCTEMDFTACPKVKKLNAFREGWGSSPLAKIYVTAAQKAAIDKGEIEALKSEESSWVVK